MRYAEVSVNSPVSQRRTFSYAIPSNLNIEAGQAVWVPFGDKTLQGIVLALSDYPSVEDTKEIAGIIEPNPLLAPTYVKLAQWISAYYLSPIFDAVALMLPPGFERSPVTFISIPADAPDYDPSTLTEKQKRVLHLAQRETKVSLKDVQKSLGVKQATLAISQLVRKGLLVRSYELEKVKVRPKIILQLKLVVTPEEAQEEVTRLLKQGKPPKRAELLQFLIRVARPAPLQEARKEIGSSKSAVDALVKQGLVTIEAVEVRRQPISYQGITRTEPLKLSQAQETAFDAIRSSLLEAKERQPSSPPSVFLLHGVTDSGKTEIYLQALAETVRLGKRGIVLVPEIALTPQTIERFVSRFGQKVAVLHSQLSLGEQFDEWQRIKNGKFDVVIGPRSAIFAPQPELGLIVIDEEQEWTYKQHDTSPRYHARSVAIKLAELTGAVVILGSATPDVETFYQVQKGKYRLLELPQRVPQGATLPDIEVVNLREELKAGQRGLFSRLLSQAIAEAINSQQQTILFLNRRGTATFVQCRQCGFVLRCRRCEVALTYHLAEDVLVCHQCNYKTPAPEICPHCLSGRIKFLGIGTQKLEKEASFTFPQAKLLRWDSDTTKQRQAHQKILDRFLKHEADILIGTQMVAKGLDLPQVTLVGVVNADTAINLPDFRAGERTFQLLSQVSGRAGRGTLKGRVIIQTYCPEHYAIKAVASHDYAGFYAQEIAYRQELHYPPFSKLVSLTFSHTSDAFCQREAEKLRQKLTQELEAKGIADLSLIGPAPAFIHRLRGRYRWQLILRGAEPSVLLSQIEIPRGWIIDVDPVGLS